MRAHHLPMPERRVSTKVIVLPAALLLGACGSSQKQPAPAAKVDSTATQPLAGSAPGSPNCPATGLWAQCSVLYRLDRAGIGPHLDSTEKAEEKALVAS